MFNRKFFVTVHLVLAAFFLPLLLMMPFSGVLYLWDKEGEVIKTEAFTISEPLPAAEDQRAAFFKDQFAQHNVSYKFESMRASRDGKDFTFKPTSRLHYTASVKDNGIVVSEANPTLLRRFIEIHKGHGPEMMRYVETFFGWALIFVAISGVWLAVTSKAYRKPLIISFVLGSAVIMMALI
jgi:hypothetical protein